MVKLKLKLNYKISVLKLEKTSFRNNNVKLRIQLIRKLIIKMN